MNADHVARLNKHQFRLVRDMHPDDLVDYLLSAEVFNVRHVKEIQKQSDVKEKSRTLLDTLKEMEHPGAFDAFVEGLNETGQHNLANLLRGNDTSLPATITSLATGGVAVGDVAPVSTDVVSVIRKLKYKTPYSSQGVPLSDTEAIKCIQQSLKEIYSKKFRMTNPLSFTFTFDIEKTWVSLALCEDNKRWTEMEDHVELLNKAFAKEKMLIIEGKPATGKTSLMHRLAYEWAQGRPELKRYDLLIYVEFRKIRERKFKSFAELLSGCLEFSLEREECEVLARCASNKNFCKAHQFLLLLDGYDGSSLDKQCEELHTYISADTIDKLLMYDIVLTTRPEFSSMYRKRQGRFMFANVLGFTKWEQKNKYISNHFSNEVHQSKKMDGVRELLRSNEDLNKLAEIPLFLMFICLVYENIVDSTDQTLVGRNETLLKLYCNIVWFLLDRHQHLFPDKNVARSFGFHEEYAGDKFQTIKENYMRFPQIHNLGAMALRNINKSAFSQADLQFFELEEIIVHVGLLRKEDNRAISSERIIQFYFPHRTIQEFLAALTYFVFSGYNGTVGTSHVELPELKTNEFQEFLWLIAASQSIENVDSLKRLNFFEKYRNPERIQNKVRDYYAERFKKINLPPSSEINYIYFPRSLFPTFDPLIKVLSSRDDRSNFYSKMYEFFTGKTSVDFSLLLTFDIEKVWVSLTIKRDEFPDTTEDYAKLINEVFAKSGMLVMEGTRGSGKTSLMRRISYDWATGKDQFKHYDYVLYAEFRKIRPKPSSTKHFKTIADLLIALHEDSLDEQAHKTLQRLFHDNTFFKHNRVLMLLDGYDEFSSELQCEELLTYLSEDELLQPPIFDVIITTRPGYLSQGREQKKRIVFVDVLGFKTMEQKQEYIFNYYLWRHSRERFANHVKDVRELLKSNKELNEIAETPLFLMFICKVQERVLNVTQLNLYGYIIRWLLESHQKKFPDHDIPYLLGFERNKYRNIPDNFFDFPQLLFLGKMALLNNDRSEFFSSELNFSKIKPIIQQVGILERSSRRDLSLHGRQTTFSFPHRPFQDFFSAFYFFYSQIDSSLETSEKVKQDSFLGSDANQTMTGLQKFFWRLASCGKYTWNRKFRAFDNFSHSRRSEFFKQHKYCP